MAKRQLLRPGCGYTPAGKEVKSPSEMFYGRSWEQVKLDDFRQEIDHYINWYNHKRIKLSLGGMSPIEYRHHLGFAA